MRRILSSYEENLIERCPHCYRRVRIKKDGTFGKHYSYKDYHCIGSGKAREYPDTKGNE